MFSGSRSGRSRSHALIEPPFHLPLALPSDCPWSIVLWQVYLSIVVLLPTFFDAHDKVAASFNEAALADAGLAWPLFFSPPEAIGLLLTIGIWTSAVAFFIADTYARTLLASCTRPARFLSLNARRRRQP